MVRLVNAHKHGRAAGSILTLEGDESHIVFFLLSGWLAISKSMEDGGRQIVDIALAGEMIDSRSANAGTSAVQIEPLTYVKYAAIPDDAWARLLDDYPEIRRMLDRNTGAALTRMSERMLRLGKGSAESRIAYALIELCVRSSAVGLVDGSAFHIPMTQQQLGDFTGLSSVHVCRTLRRLERNRILSVTDHMDIAIHDTAALAEIAEIDPEALRNDIVPAA